MMRQINILRKSHQAQQIEKTRERLFEKGWRRLFVTNAQFLFFKKNWRCAINRETGEWHFDRVDVSKMTLGQLRMTK